MFLVSGVELVVACSTAGLLGTFPTLNARTTDILDGWLGEISERLAGRPLGANLVVQVKNNQVLRVLPLEKDAVNECWLADRDRFAVGHLVPRLDLERVAERVPEVQCAPGARLAFVCGHDLAFDATADLDDLGERRLGGEGGGRGGGGGRRRPPRVRWTLRRGAARSRAGSGQ